MNSFYINREPRGETKPRMGSGAITQLLMYNLVKCLILPLSYPYVS